LDMKQGYGHKDKAVRILITGGTGLLGAALQYFAPGDIACFSVYYPERPLPLPLPFPMRAADVSNPEQMRSIFAWARPDLVIHTAAIGSVDYAQSHGDETAMVNVGGTKVVAELCRIFQAAVVYISSNAVFDGENPLYAETDPVNPINCYGRLKVDAEDVIRNSGVPWAIVRPILMYGWPYPGERDNPVVWWVRSLESGKGIKVVDNVFSKPLSVWSCAEAVWTIVRRSAAGIYHIAGRDHISLYEFALVTAEVFDLNPRLIEPVPDSYFPEIAPRPRDTSFDTTKMETELGLKPQGVKEGLAYMKSRRPPDDEK